MKLRLPRLLAVCVVPTAIVLSPLVARAELTFASYVSSSTTPDLGPTAYPCAVVTADFNKDGKPDLALANRGESAGAASSVVFFAGDGAGAFSRGDSVLASGAGINDLVWADFNKDGKLDLAATQCFNNQVQTLLGNGDGTFTAGSATAVGTAPSALAVGDFNRDGKPDVAVANTGSAAPWSTLVSLRLGDGTGGFTSATDLAVSAGPDRILAADFNRDGKLDLAVGSVKSSTLSIYTGKGDGTFNTTAAGSISVAAGDLTAADINRDGKLDLVIGSSGSEGVRVAMGQGTGAFDTPVAYGASLVSAPTSVAVTDVDGDGVLDLVAVDGGTLGSAPHVTRVSIFTGQAGGTFAATPTSFPLAGESGDASALVAGDFDRDGRPDFAATILNAGTSSVILNRTTWPSAGTTLKSPTLYYTDYSFAYALSSGDFDRDGKPDLALAHYVGTRFQTYLGSASGTFTRSQDTAPATFLFLATGDFDRDGDLDVAASRTDQARIQVLLNDGTGTLAGTTSYVTDTARCRIATGDLNGDGILDLVAANNGNEAGRSITVNLGKDDGTFNPKVSYSVPNAPQSVALGDLDGDGDLDVVVTVYSTVDGSDSAEIFMNNGDGSLATPVAFTGMTQATGIVAADLDRDCDLDLAIVGNGRICVWLNDGAGAFPATPSNTSTVSMQLRGLAAADLNRDGILDLAATTYQVNASVLVYALGNGNGSFQTPKPFSGGAGSRQAPALVIDDFNQDGAPDIALVQPTSSSPYPGQLAVFLNHVLALPTITTWPAASAITEGQALSASTLTGGSASVDGTFAFESPATTPPAGTYSASVVFSPTDTANYMPVTGSVDVTVHAAKTTRTAVGAGNWSDPSTWSPAGVPAEDDEVTIPTGTSVTVNVDTLAVGTLTVQGTLTFSGNSTLKVSGNFTLESTAAFTPGTGTVELTGSGNQTLEAAAPASLTFYNLKINKDAKTDTVTAASKLKVTKKLSITKGKLLSASDYLDILIENEGELELTSDITVGGDLEIQSDGTLTTAGFKITFDGEIEQHVTLAALTSFDDVTVTANTTLIEVSSDDSFWVFGTLVNEGVIRKTQAIGALEAYYFGLAGRADGDLEVAVTALGANPLTSLTVDRRDTNHPHPPGTEVTGIYWTLTPTGSDYTVDLTLPYADTLTSPKVCRYESGQWDWDALNPFADGLVTRVGITAMSDWAVYENPKKLTTTAVSSDLNPAGVGQSVTFTATVTPSGATGAVTFKDGGTVLGTDTLESGQATWTTSALTEGDHTITAEYGGDTDYVGSTSDGLTQTMNQPTAARLDYFRAWAAEGAGVALRWRTLAEWDVLGFVIEREGTGGWTRVNAELIAAVGGDLQPQEYGLRDAGVGRRYRLLEVDLRGQLRVVAEAEVIGGERLAIGIEGEGLRIEWRGVAGASGVLETATDAMRGPWEAAGTIERNTPVTRTLGTGEPMRFYRVRSSR